MRKVTPITEQFQHFVEDLQESFWGDLCGRTRLAWKKFFEAESLRERDRLVPVRTAIRPMTMVGISSRVGIGQIDRVVARLTGEVAKLLRDLATLPATRPYDTKSAAPKVCCCPFWVAGNPDRSVREMRAAGSFLGLSGPWRLQE